METFRRSIVDVLRSRLLEPRKNMQVILGPRQVGKTTAVMQALEGLAIPWRYATADLPTPPSTDWLAAEWGEARKLAGAEGAVFVIDEVQKITQWSEMVKKCWDEDTWHRVNLDVVLLGSSTFLIHAGLTETLVGRFEVIRAPHWSFSEMRDCFGWNLDQYIFFGGYPGAAGRIDEEDRWRNYIREAVLEPTISRDAMLLRRVDKPVLLRQVMELACQYSGQVLSYTKMIGQLNDAGNTTTVANYLAMLASIGIISGLPKFSRGIVRRRASSPKLQVWNNALLNAQSSYTFNEARSDPAVWGRIVESAVGAHILNSTFGSRISTHYWADGDNELDFVLARGPSVLGIEVKTSASRTMPRGLGAFLRAHPGSANMLIGPTGTNLERALSMKVDEYF